MITMKDLASKMDEDADMLLANTLRFLAADMIQRAHSGHPGLPLGAADIVTVLWAYFLKFDPSDPTWPNRDRFILSAGHGSALLYALLHLFGFKLSTDDLQAFRQYGSLTPGHPELQIQLGIETTTGPLGQGLGNAVGLAIAERWLAAKFNRPRYPLLDHNTFVLVGDGDLMEGVSHEAASLAGHLQLGRLIVMYDDNGVSIDGPTDLSCSDNVAMRFIAYGWQVVYCDGHDRRAIYNALNKACADQSRPSLIVCRTHIGYGSPLQDSSKAHGEPLGEDNLRQTKMALGWPIEPSFFVPSIVQERLTFALQRHAACRQAWQSMLSDYRRDYPEMAMDWDQWRTGKLPDGWQAALADYSYEAPEATRSASGRALERLAEVLPFLIGGSADLTPSNNTRPKLFNTLSARDYGGRYIHFGVREHGMGAILNGLALHGLRPYGGTFLVFSDYMRPSIRLAALMGLPVVYVFTHDSIGVGEDGPTHQPVEHLMALRAIPNLWVIRPADNCEVAEAWRVALERQDGPTALILTRQALPQVARANSLPAQGAYIVANPPNGESPALILAASGSEVSVALGAHDLLQTQGIVTRVVSMPCWELFETQSQEYRSHVFPENIAVFAIEAGVTQGWPHYTKRTDAVLGIDRFGASGPANILFEQLGFTPEGVMKKIRRTLFS